MRIPFTFAVVLHVTLSPAQPDRAIFDMNRDAAFEALAQSDYDRALKFFNEAQSNTILKKDERDMINLKMLVDEFARLTQKRKELGTIKPVVRHKTMVLWVEEVDGVYNHPTKGKIKINQKLSEEDKKIARIRMGVMREIYEAMSSGNMTIDFEEVLLKDPLAAIRLYDGNPWPNWDLFDGATEIVRANFDTHDTFIWCTTLIQGAAHGGYSRFPLGKGTLTPQKGFIEINPRFSPNMWIHEFFHVVEGMTGISPSHGHHKENKAHFPSWPGKVDNELDYYSWHFSTTIPAKGWDKLKIKSKLADEDPGDPLESLSDYKEIGTWQPSEVGNDWAEMEWKLNSDKLRAGQIKIMILYTSGWKALDIAWVSLWQNDKQLAIDEHFGFSGTKKRKIIYTLNVSENLKGPFIIKAKVKGDNGTDSNGRVLVKF